MVVFNLDALTEVALYRDLEVRAPRGQAVRKLLELITKN